MVKGRGRRGVNSSRLFRTLIIMEITCCQKNRREHGCDRKRYVREEEDNCQSAIRYREHSSGNLYKLIFAYVFDFF